MSGFLRETDLDSLARLSLLQRLLLVCDGTLTDMVEAAFLEPVKLVKVAVATASASDPVAELELHAGEMLMRRRILLQGAQSGINYVYAESLIAVSALPPALGEALLQSDAPLGRLWVQHQLETRKEILRIWRVNGGESEEWFGEAAAGGQLARRYRVISGGRPVMLISEYFPISSTGGGPAAPQLPLAEGIR